MRIISSVIKCLCLCLALCLAGAFLPGCGARSDPQGENKIVRPQSEEGKEGDVNMHSTASQQESPFACNMSALNGDEKKRVLDLLDELKAKKQEVKELPDGFAFRYTMDSKTLRNAAEYITYERLCCPFFDFELAIEREGGPLWLNLKGREGVKDFIRTEFGL